MLSTAENERLTRVGPGTPMGELMRRYWQPVAVTSELNTRPTRPVRILSEDLVLYRDRSGEYGLIDRYCAHRRVDLSYGIPEEHGLRCMYHGWMFDAEGQCIEQPFEETVHPDGRFKEKVRLTSYPAQELGGLIWAYLGPAPAPLLPRWDLLAWDNVLRDIGVTVLPCNWLQCMENSLDPVHTEWLHVYQTSTVLEREGEIADRSELPRRAHQKVGFDRYENGIVKKRVVEGTTEDDPEWTVGHPIIFPNWLGGTTGFQMRVPIDDTHTWHILYNVYVPPEGVVLEPQEEIPGYDVPYVDEEGTRRRELRHRAGHDGVVDAGAHRPARTGEAGTVRHRHHHVPQDAGRADAAGGGRRGPDEHVPRPGGERDHLHLRRAPPGRRAADDGTPPDRRSVPSRRDVRRARPGHGETRAQSHWQVRPYRPHGGGDLRAVGALASCSVLQVLATLQA